MGLEMARLDPELHLCQGEVRQAKVRPELRLGKVWI